MSTAVKVYLRTRILSESEKADGCYQVVKAKKGKDGFRVQVVENAADVEEQGAKPVLSDTFDFEGGFMQEDGQEGVYEEVAAPLLQLGFDKGNNSCIFAYGQTGAGKTYSMIGGTKNGRIDPGKEGLIPRILRKFFDEIERVEEQEPEYVCTLGMQVVEIYVEKVRNLLPFSSPNDAAAASGELPAPEPVKYFRNGLPTVKPIPLEIVGLPASIELVQKAYANRATRKHNLNPDSSRGHCIYILEWRKVRKDGEAGATTFKMYLIDLAGRESASRAGTTGQGFLEGSAINKSLVELESAIHMMALGKRDVPMTSALLTIMRKTFQDGYIRVLCAVSPAHVNLMEIKGTFDFAQTCKKVQLRVQDHKEEDPLAALEAEFAAKKAALEAEIERVRAEAQRNDPATQARLAAEKAELEAEMAAEIDALDARRQRVLERDNAMAAQAARQAAEWAAVTTEATGPHLSNLEPDALLVGTLNYPLDTSSNTVIGVYDADRPPDIVISGLGMQKRHAIASSDEEGRFYIEPGTLKARIVVDGRVLTARTEVLHNSRVWLGQMNCFRVVLPDREAYAWRPAGAPIDWVPDYAFAVNELNSAGDELAGGDAQLLRAIGAVMRMCDRANSMALELAPFIKQRLDYAPRLVGDEPVVVATMRDGGEVAYKQREFEDKLAEMDVLYADYADARQRGEKDTFTLSEGNPFDLQRHRFVFAEGAVFLVPVRHMTSLTQTVTVVRTDGSIAGEVDVDIYPVNAKGEICGKGGRAGEWDDDELADDPYVDDPADLIGKTVTVEVVARRWRESDEHGRETETLYSNVQAALQVTAPGAPAEPLSNGDGNPSKLTTEGELLRSRFKISVENKEVLDSLNTLSATVMLSGLLDVAVAQKRMMHAEQCSTHARSELMWQISKLNRDIQAKRQELFAKDSELALLQRQVAAKNLNASPSNVADV